MSKTKSIKKCACAYCGTTVTKRTKGHVIPKSIYLDLQNIQQVTVPECLSCKALWEDAKPHFRNVMIAIWDPEVILKDSRYQNFVRSLKKCDGKRRLKNLTERFVPTETANGKRHLIYPAKDPQCNLILRRIIRGLCHFHGVLTAVPDGHVYSDVMLRSIPQELQSHFTWHEIAPDFFRYAYSIVEDDKMHSFWLLQFSKHIVFYGVVTAHIPEWCLQTRST